MALLARSVALVLLLSVHLTAAPPNVVLMFTDDQGYGDVGCFGAEGYETPNLDRLAAEGARFTDFYVSSPVCSASRAALLTGCYHERVGIQGALGPKTPHGLNPEETTLADLCKLKGYATAIFGKWHLGRPEHLLPPSHGFDEYFGIPYSNDMWPHHPGVRHLPYEERLKRWPELPLIEGTKVVNPALTPEDQSNLTVQLTEKAVDFIDRNAAKPFFLYVPHPQPHVPLFASGNWAGKTKRGLFGDVISEIDWSMGEIMKALEKHGLRDNTLVIFTCDNGPWLAYGDHCGSAGPLREGKGTCWEGGIRVPFIARWPAKIPAGLVSSEPASTIDILPTVAAALGAELPERKIDGKDITRLLTDPKAKSPHEALFFYYKQNQLQAMRAGKWKLILPHNYRSMEGREGGKDGVPEPYNNNMAAGLGLYDLHEDIGETKNLAKTHPEVVADLIKQVEAMREDLGDSLTKKKGAHRRPAGK